MAAGPPPGHHGRVTLRHAMSAIVRGCSGGQPPSGDGSLSPLRHRNQSPPSCGAPWSGPDRTLAAALLWLLAALVYMGNGRYTSAPDTTPSELLPISLLTEGNLDFDEFTRPGEPLPYFYASRNDRVVSFYPVLPGLLNVPVHVLAKAYGLDLYRVRYALAKTTAATVVALSVAFMFLALTRVCTRRETAVMMALVYGFGTHSWSVASQGLWQHGPSLLLLSIAVWLLLSPGRLCTPLAGLFLGLAVFNRPSNLVFALPLALYMATQRRQMLGWFLACAAGPAIAMAWYSHSYWGSVFALGQGHRFDGTHGIHHTRLLAPLLPGLAGLLFSPNRGLFVFTPVFIIAVPWWIAALWQRRSEAVWRYLASGAVLHLLLYGTWSVWWGGWSFGYRLLIEMLPVLTLFLAIAWDRWVSLASWRIGLFSVLTVASVYVQALGALAYPTGWNAAMDIDRNPSRCWNLRDTELGRCQAKLFRLEKR